MKIALLGYGNLGSQFAHALVQHQFELVQIYNRSQFSLHPYLKEVPVVHNLDTLAFADVYFLALADDAISSVTAAIHNKDSLFVHFSGAGAKDLIKCGADQAVAWPMFSFSNKANWSEISIALDAKGKSKETLEHIFSTLGAKLYQANVEDRRNMHVAATFVNNFGNHLLTEAKAFCQEKNIPFESFYQLARQTVEHAFKFGPENSQTGAALRKDEQTIDLHKQRLSSEDQIKLYELFTQLIQQQHG